MSLRREYINKHTNIHTHTAYNLPYTYWSHWILLGFCATQINLKHVHWSRVEGIPELEWPSQSLDLNEIADLWLEKQFWRPVWPITSSTSVLAVGTAVAVATLTRGQQRREANMALKYDDRTCPKINPPPQPPPPWLCSAWRTGFWAAALRLSSNLQVPSLLSQTETISAPPTFILTGGVRAVWLVRRPRMYGTCWKTENHQKQVMAGSRAAAAVHHTFES